MILVFPHGGVEVFAAPVLVVPDVDGWERSAGETSVAVLLVSTE